MEAQFSAPPPQSQHSGPLLRASYPAEAESVARARRAVAELAMRLGASEEAVAAIRLATSEAITNAVIHGYRGSPGRILLTATADGDELFVVVQDEGCGLKVPPTVPGLGVGWAVIADACEEFTVLERGGGGAELQMRFALGRAAPLIEDESCGERQPGAPAAADASSSASAKPPRQPVGGVRRRPAAGPRRHKPGASGLGACSGSPFA